MSLNHFFGTRILHDDPTSPLQQTSWQRAGRIESAVPSIIPSQLLHTQQLHHTTTGTGGAAGPLRALPTSTRHSTIRPSIATTSAHGQPPGRPPSVPRERTSSISANTGRPASRLRSSSSTTEGNTAPLPQARQAIDVVLADRTARLPENAMCGSACGNTNSVGRPPTVCQVRLHHWRAHTGARLGRC